jgi:thiaminase
MSGTTQTTQNAFYDTLHTRWGVGEKELEETTESAATTVYGAYTMDIGLQGDTVKFNAAISACLLEYGEVGLWLTDESKHPDNRVLTHYGRAVEPLPGVGWRVL